MMDEMNGTVTNTIEETDRHCPDCDGIMKFDPKTGGLSCPYCGHTEEIPVGKQIHKNAQEIPFDNAEKTANCDWGVEKKTVVCKSCAAVLIYDALQTSGVCPFCGSNQVTEAGSEDTIAPGGVIPFAVTDKQAAEYFNKWIKKKWFCPKPAKDSAKPKAFQGVYLPYWVFNAEADTRYTAEYGKERRVNGEDGNTEVEIKWYRTRGDYESFIKDRIVLASKNHDERMLDGLEPFQIEQNKAYKPEYVAGFISERYSIGLKDGWENAKVKIATTLKKEVRDEVKGIYRTEHVRSVSIDPTFRCVTYKYLMLPVWSSNFKYNGKVYQFMVNGQTGKVSGKTPLSILRIIIVTIIAIAIVAGGYYFTHCK